MQMQPIFRALADPTRRDILLMLSKDSLTIAQISDQFEMTRGAVKKHLTVLEQGNLIQVQTRGREKLNRLNPKALQPAFDWLGYFESFWDEKLSNLKTLIEIDTTERPRHD
ncbi:metalloregulator ArsR/SmtB family transcription factor [Cognatishimia sp. WU-CL00825]|uniref:ArsR/SmtB family transcription factor n=1 Tax=Cognatishimia sp. WU-CL00825 TaxID=3127658 RepID=UPI00310C1A22